MILRGIGFGECNSMRFSSISYSPCTFSQLSPTRHWQAHREDAMADWRPKCSIWCFFLGFKPGPQESFEIRTLNHSCHSCLARKHTFNPDIRRSQVEKLRWRENKGLVGQLWHCLGVESMCAFPSRQVWQHLSLCRKISGLSTQMPRTFFLGSKLQSYNISNYYLYSYTAILEYL